jgi:toxin HigB-1
VEIRFTSSKTAKLCNSEKEMRGELGPRCAARLQQRLEELRAATTLEDMRCLPGARCHELTQDRKGQLAVDLVHPRRLVFQPAHDPVPTKSDGGLDWSKITEVVILEVVDYH